MKKRRIFDMKIVEFSPFSFFCFLSRNRKNKKKRVDLRSLLFALLCSCFFFRFVFDSSLLFSLFSLLFLKIESKKDNSPFFMSFLCLLFLFCLLSFFFLILAVYLSLHCQSVFCCSLVSFCASFLFSVDIVAFSFSSAHRTRERESECLSRCRPAADTRWPTRTAPHSARHEQPINYSTNAEKQNYFTQIVRLSVTPNNQQGNNNIFVQKDIKGFEAESFYVIKPNECKNWHPAIAHLDIGEFTDAI